MAVALSTKVTRNDTGSVLVNNGVLFHNEVLRQSITHSNAPSYKVNGTSLALS